MIEHAVECQSLCKKFTRGERADSLRDAIPALARALLGKRRQGLGRDQFWALEDVSFDLPRGEALGVIGPNGAGKSTLLRILSRILVPDRGTVSINGRLTALIEVGAGFHPDLTGRENVYLNGAILGMSRREINSKIGEIIDFAGVGKFIDTPVKRYSSGMQARLGFAVAAHMDPEILLVDEVLAVGDAQFQQRCLDKMHHFAHSGKSIIFISHNLQAVAALCPQTLLLMDGRHRGVGCTSQIIRKYLSLMREETAAVGDRSVSLHNVRLLDTSGTPANRFTAGQSARLIFDVQLDQPPSNYLLGLGIKRVTDGLIVSDYNLDLPVGQHERGPLSMTVEFEANLLTGSYAVVLFLLHKASYEKPVYLDFVKVFDVAASEARDGVAHIAPSLKRRQVLAEIAG